MLLGVEALPPPQGGRPARGFELPPPGQGVTDPVVWPAHVRSPNQRRVWTSLQEGAGTAAELAVETSLNANMVSNILCRWRDAGHVRVVHFTCGRHRPAQRFEMVEVGDGDSL